MIFTAAATGEFPVTGLVSTECLIRREGFIAYGAIVTELGCGRWRWRRRSGGGGAAASEHDETESEVLFLGTRRVVVVVEAGITLGTLSFSPRMVWVVKGEGWRSGGG